MKKAIHFNRGVKKSNFPSHGFFLVLIGPDGAGKTTTAKALLNSRMVKKLFPHKRLYFYRRFGFLPELKVIVSVFKKNKRCLQSPDKERALAPTQFGPLRSMIYPLYYGIEYFLGRFLAWKEKRKWGALIVFDRYFFEFFSQKHLQRCPRWLLFFISKIIAQPDAIIFLKNTPENIYARKQELSLEEIKRQSKECEKIIKYFPQNGFIVETSSSLNEVIKEIQQIIIGKLKIRQPPLFYE